MLACKYRDEIRGKLWELGIRTFVGSTITYKEKKFTICGVIADVASSGFRPYEATEGIMIPISTALRLAPSPIREVLARVAPDHSWQTASTEMTIYFQHPGRKIDISIRSAEELIRQMEEQMRLYSLLLGAIGSISLIVGGVGVMNVMLVSVTERRKEIGIRRALGAQKTDVQLQFIIESVLLCLAGGVIGTMLGAGGAWGFSSFNGWGFFLSGGALLLGVGVSCFVGVFFGYYPARQASQLSPIEALRAS